MVKDVQLSDWHLLIYCFLPNIGEISFEDLRNRFTRRMKPIGLDNPELNRCIENLIQAGFVSKRREKRIIAGFSTEEIFYRQTRLRPKIQDKERFVREYRASLRIPYYKRPYD